ncbi:MAG: hypothetical protein VXZ72_01360, partial [Chlamydiota bacterium]|nr:hypothetical protein [Chlamydiota bacterium]
MAFDPNNLNADEKEALYYLMWASNRDWQQRAWVERRVNNKYYDFGWVFSWRYEGTECYERRTEGQIINLPWGDWANEKFILLDKRINDVHYAHNLP